MLRDRRSHILRMYVGDRYLWFHSHGFWLIPSHRRGETGKPLDTRIGKHLALAVAMAVTEDMGVD